MIAWIAFATFVAVSSQSTTQTPTATKDKGRQILIDTSLFPDSMSGPFLELSESMSDLTPKTGAIFGAPVGVDRAPALADLEKKYGKADRVEARKGRPTSPGPSFDATVHWYGEFGFCVPSAPGATGAGKVIWVLWDRPPRS